jgi:excisionase family DNA binding protein
VDKLYSIKDAGQRLGGISPWTIEAWLSKGKLKRTKAGRRTLISETEIQRFLAECGLAASKGGSRREGATDPKPHGQSAEKAGMLLGDVNLESTDV